VLVRPLRAPTDPAMYKLNLIQAFPLMGEVPVAMPSGRIWVICLIRTCRQSISNGPLEGFSNKDQGMPGTRSDRIDAKPHSNMWGQVSGSCVWRYRRELRTAARRRRPGRPPRRQRFASLLNHSGRAACEPWTVPSTVVCCGADTDGRRTLLRRRRGPSPCSGLQLRLRSPIPHAHAEEPDFARPRPPCCNYAIWSWAAPHRARCGACSS